jgi:hypothetical protein
MSQPTISSPDFLNNATPSPIRRNVVLPACGLQLPPGSLPYAKWLSVGRELSAVADSSAWCLGDWLIYGEDAFPGRYREAINQTSLKYQTLRNYAWVARRFTFARRRSALSFGHHAEVAGLSDPEQEFWMRKAEQLGWSRNHLRREVRTSLLERNRADREEVAAEDQPSGAQVTFELSAEQRQLSKWTLAARADAIPVEEWVVLVLDDAAKTTLGRRSA